MKVWPKSREELNSILDSIEAEQLDYNTAADAMWKAALAAFNYMSSKVGASGFQASYAELQFLKNSRNLEYFSIIDFERLLYPQYDIVKELMDNIEKAKPWLKKKAQKLLEDVDFAHLKVIKHWEKLAQ